MRMIAKKIACPECDDRIIARQSCRRCGGKGTLTDDQYQDYIDEERCRLLGCPAPAPERESPPAPAPLIFAQGATAAAIRSAETNRAGPLRAIVDVHAETYGAAEVLECGHKGQYHRSAADVRFWINQGKRRRCAMCGPAWQPKG